MADYSKKGEYLLITSRMGFTETPDFEEFSRSIVLKRKNINLLDM